MQHEGHQARFLADAQPSVGKQLIDPHDRPIAVEAQRLHDRERLIQKNALADLQAGQRNLRIDTADVIGARDTNVGLVRLYGHQQRADAECG